MENAIVPYYKYPNEFLVARYQKSIQEFIENTKYSMKHDRLTLYLHCLLSTYIYFLQGSICHREFNCISNVVLSDLACKLNRGKVMLLDVDMLRARHGLGIVREYNELISQARWINLMLRATGFATLQYTN